MKHSVFNGHTFHVLEDEGEKWVNAHDVFTFNEEMGLPETWGLKKGSCLFFDVDGQLRLFLPWAEACGFLNAKAKTSAQQLAFRDFARAKYAAMEDCPEFCFHENLVYSLSALTVAADLGILQKAPEAFTRATRYALDKVTPLHPETDLVLMLDVFHRLAQLNERLEEADIQGLLLDELYEAFVQSEE